MGATKKHFYQNQQLRISDLCKALGHPARIAIVEMLSQNEHMNCENLQSTIELSQSSISEHCLVLHRCGIIGYEVVGNNCYYKLDNRVLDLITNFVEEINTEMTSLTGKVYYTKCAN